MAAKKAGCFWFRAVLSTIFTSLLAPVLVHFIIERIHTPPRAGDPSREQLSPAPARASQGGWNRPWADVKTAATAATLAGGGEETQNR
jgi:hypothetical protein